MHLRQPQFLYRACGPFAGSKERRQKYKETGYSRYTYQDELDKACFQHDMVYGDLKDLPRRTASDKSLRVKPFNIAKNSKYDEQQHGLAPMVYTFSNRKSADSNISGGAVTHSNKSAIKSEILQNQHPMDLATRQLSEELHKTVIRKFEKKKICILIF